MNPSEILSNLTHKQDLYLFDSLDSTNTWLKAKAREGAASGTLVIARSQTGGKGRRGRSFFSPEGGVYLSLLVDSPGYTPGQITTLAAVSALKAIEEIAGIKPRLKWVNDLMLNGKKLGGILCEGILTDGKITRTVIGIGVNTGDAAFPEDLSGIATSLGALQQGFSKERLIAALVNDLLDNLPLIPNHMDLYRKNCLTLGQTVHFELENMEYTGLAEEVRDDGALLVKTASGIVCLLAGEVSLIKDRA